MSDDRMAASRAAEESRAAQLKLSDAVRGYIQQGIPIPFAVDGERTGGRGMGQALAQAAPTCLNALAGAVTLVTGRPNAPAILIGSRQVAGLGASG